MAVQILIVLFSAVFVGIVLVAWGWRGRRLDDHPVCRQCRFDLTGVLPGGVTCPECGSGVKRERAVRIGNRRRRWWAVVVGVLLAVLPGALLGLVFAGTLAGADLNKHKPVALLMWEAGHRGDAAACDAAAEEVLGRFLIGKWGDGRVSGVVETTLAIQGDHGRHWPDALGELVGTGDVRGQVSEEQMARFLRQAPVVGVKARERVDAGSVLPIFVELKEARTAPGTQYQTQVLVESATLDGRAIEPTRVGQEFVVSFGKTAGDATPIGLLWLMSSRSTSGGFTYGAQAVSCTLAVSKSVSPGRHTLRLSLRLLTNDPNARGALTPISFGEVQQRAEHIRQRYSVLMDFEQTVEVAPQSDPVVALLPADKTQAAQVQSRVMVAGVSVMNRGMSQFVNAHFQSMPGEPDFAFDVLLRSGETEWELGQISSSPIMSSVSGGFPAFAVPGGTGSATISHMINKEIEGMDATVADIVLRPNLEAARRTLDLEHICGSEIILRNQKVRHRDQQGNALSAPPEPKASTMNIIARALFGESASADKGTTVDEAGGEHAHQDVQESVDNPGNDSLDEWPGEGGGSDQP